VTLRANTKPGFAGSNGKSPGTRLKIATYYVPYCS
jgi:hypothetical protein